MIGIIQAKEFSKAGAAKFRIANVWYFLNRNAEPQDFAPGTSVEFEYEEFGEDRGRGRPKAIKKWRQVQQSAANGSGGTTMASMPQLITDYNLLQSTSNIVGHACAAGTIKTPEELEKWVTATWQALKQAPGLKSASREPGSDDDFDDSLPRNMGGETRSYGDPNAY